MMAFVVDKEELMPGLVIFRRADVQHRNWYCRVKLPKADRYKTVSLKTNDVNAARTLALKQGMRIEHAIEFGHPIFNRPFREVAKEYHATQVARAKRGEIAERRPHAIKTAIEGPLEDYVGSTQVSRIGDDLWGSYPAWRRENGEGRIERNGVRQISHELAVRLVTQDQAGVQKHRAARKLRAKPFTAKEFDDAVAKKMATPVPFISDATIGFEMSIFGAVMQFAIKKRYIAASQRFEERPKLQNMRREEFTREEYRYLHEFARQKWMKGIGPDGKKPDTAQRANSKWYRAVTYNFMLIMCNTGMRPPEARNLRWRDISTAKDRDGRDMMVIFVQGKGKTRKLVAPESVGEYFDRIREKSKATKPDDRVFTTINGKPTSTLYKHPVDSLLTAAGLRYGPCGTMRSVYSFRHTYATFRLSEGTDVYFLAEQMGTSVKMIEDHYGHVNTIKHADRVLTGMYTWEVLEGLPDAGPDNDDSKKTAPKADAKTNAKTNAKARQAAKMRQPPAKPRGKKTT